MLMLSFTVLPHVADCSPLAGSSMPPLSVYVLGIIHPHAAILVHIVPGSGLIPTPYKCLPGGPCADTPVGVTNAVPVIVIEPTLPVAKTPVTSAPAPAWPCAVPTDIVPATPVTENVALEVVETLGVFVVPARPVGLITEAFITVTVPGDPNSRNACKCKL